MPSPGKYVVKKQYPVADSPSSSIAKRSTTLSTTGRSFTIGDSKVHFQKPHLNFIISKPSNESKPPTPKMKLTKAVSKKSSSLHASMYDENFIRYVKELDSYFKASELRNRSTEDAKRKTEAFAATRNQARYATEMSTSMEASSGSLSDAHSFSLDSPQVQKKKSLPRVSVVYDTAPHIDLLDSPISFSETASSYYATPDQDRSFITTPSDNYSFFATASEQSSYLTAEIDSLDGSHTFVQDLKQFSSQETLFNDDDDVFKDDDEDDDDDDHDEDEDEMRDRVGELVLPSSSTSVVAAFSRLNLGYYKYDNLNDEAAGGSDAQVSTSPEWKVEAKVRRSNFVRTTCIDLEEEEGGKNDDVHRPSTSDLAISLDKDQEKETTSKNLRTKCSPV